MGESKTERAKGRFRVSRLPRQFRTVAVLALVALAGIGGGMLVSTRIVSPSQAAADAAPPEPQPITVPIGTRVITNEVTARGDGSFAEPQQLTLMTNRASGPSVITGRVPDVGAEVQAGTVLVEVTGRPVIVLPGAIPTYRDLGWGMSGPDVQQLKAALLSLGIDPGDPDSDVYDVQTAEAVTALYARVGYPAPEAPADAASALEAAQEEERAAEQAVVEASAAVADASAGMLPSERIDLDTQVAVAEAALAELADQCALAGATCSQSEVVAAQGAVAQARARRDEATAAPDVSRETSALRSAQAALDSARDKVAEASSAVLVGLPAAEVVMVKDLPRRIDQVNVALGDTVTGAVASVSSTALTVQAVLPAESAALVAVGMAARTTVDGQDVDLTVSAVGETAGSDPSTPGDADTGADDAGTDNAGASDAGTGTPQDTSAPAAGSASSSVGGEVAIRLDPVGELAPETATALRGANVRVTIPVSSTGGDVLAVPLAALTSGPGGETRVSIAQADGQWQLVTVETGLAAQGYVEIVSADPDLKAGDRVLIGESTGAGG
ncbi:hypothetical protein [Cellulomonas taurus]|uniref:hypothetical protein n=1 Tax=Cellulomonas taurus TaxID=2729175 RepID=UPI00145F96FF|nr:hypothetical protein [Cellulomonas taurus]